MGASCAKEEGEMSIPRPTRNQYLKPGACKHEGCTATWQEGPRTQKYCAEHQKAAGRRYDRKHRRLHAEQIAAYQARRWREKRQEILAGQRRRYAARKEKAA